VYNYAYLNLKGLKMRTDRINITLPDYISSQLNEFSEELGEKKSHIIASALERYYDYLDIKVAEKRANEKEETFTLEEVRKTLGL
jgi:metal-responsive CopG/Arc/MetJ family transcriptional regulator